MLQQPLVKTIGKFSNDGWTYQCQEGNLFLIKQCIFYKIQRKTCRVNHKLISWFKHT